MPTAPLLSFASSKLGGTIAANGVVHTCPGSPADVWTDISVLRHGGEGTVRLQQQQTGPTQLLRAVKQWSQDQRRSSAGPVMRELDMMTVLCAHEQLFVQLFGWFEDPGGNAFLAMEYVPHGDLPEYIKTTTDGQRESREVTKQLLAGLSVLHSRHICHRDLTSPYILLASLASIKVNLADFGISKSTARSDMRTGIGTAHQLVPRQLRLLPPRLRLDIEYTPAVDMWALGFIVHEMLTGSTPFLETPSQTMSSIYPTDATGESALNFRLLLQFCDGDAGLPLELLEAVDASESEVPSIRRLLVSDPRNCTTVVQALIEPSMTIQPSPEPVTEPQALRDRGLPHRVPAPLYTPLEAPAWTKTSGGRLATLSGESSELARYVAVSPTTVEINELIGFHNTYGRYSDSPFAAPAKVSGEAKRAWLGSESRKEGNRSD